jgi:hypothetical protein
MNKTKGAFNMTFSQRVNEAVCAAYADLDYNPSKAEVCYSLQPIITDLLAMTPEAAEAYIRAGFATRYDALAVRMYKVQRESHQLGLARVNGLSDYY